MVRDWWAGLFPDTTHVPQEFRDKHWGINNSPDWGEPAWPGWRKPARFWDSWAPVVIIFAIGLSGPISIALFAVAPLLWP